MPRFLMMLVVVVAMSLGLSGCFYGDPENASESSDGDLDIQDTGVVLGPQGGSLESEDGQFTLTVTQGSLTQELLVRVSALEPSAFPEAGELLLSKVYWLEPALELDSSAQITIKVPEGTTGFIGRYALTLKVAEEGGSFGYVQASEVVQADAEGNSETRLEGMARSIRAVGLFHHEAFLYCNLHVHCPARGVDPAAMENAMVQCMNEFGWATETQDPQLMGASHEAYLCALERPCAEIECCADDSCDNPTDGDTPDGDEDGDIPDGDEDGDEDGDLDGDEDGDEDGDTEEDDPYAPLTCQVDTDCQDGRVCRAVPGVSDGFGRCLFASPGQDLTGYRHTGTELQVVEASSLDLACGTQDPANVSGPGSFVLQAVFSPFSPLDNKEGITVQAFLEANPGSAIATATTDTEGKALLEGVRPNAWFFLVAQRQGDTAQSEVLPTYNYGLWVDGATATSHTQTDNPLEIAYYAVSRIRYQSLSLATTGELEGPPEGTGMLVGQVFACNDDEPLTLANATIGFADVQPEMLAYFNTSASLPQVQASQQATNNNGLFIAAPLPVGPVGRPFALGRVNNAENVFATSRSTGPQIHDGAVSVIRLGRYR